MVQIRPSNIIMGGSLVPSMETARRTVHRDALSADKTLTVRAPRICAHTAYPPCYIFAINLYLISPLHFLNHIYFFQKEMSLKRFSLSTKINTLLISRNVRCNSSTLSKAQKFDFTRHVSFSEIPGTGFFIPSQR